MAAISRSSSKICCLDLFAGMTVVTLMRFRETLHELDCLGAWCSMGCGPETAATCGANF